MVITTHQDSPLARFKTGCFPAHTKVSPTHRHPIAPACLLWSLLLFAPLFGFGQNKVQYLDFSWNYLPSSHFTLYYHQQQGDLPVVSYRLMDDIYRTLQARFRFTHKEPVPVIVYGDPNLFTQTNVITELLPEEVGGFTEIFKSRVVVPFSGSYDELNHVLHHEMTHAFVYGIFYDQMGANLLAGGGLQIPLWFMEGLAEYLSSGWNIESDMFLMDYTINSEVPPPGPMLDGYMAYKGGQSFLFYLASSRSDTLFTKFLRDFKTSKSLEKTVKAVYKKSPEDLGKEWIQELKRLYWPEIGRRTDPARTATAVTSHTEIHDNFNLRPRISPDGKHVAFFSDRYDYTKILITDRSGKVQQQVSQTGYGGFFESFHPFRSGMCWSPDGQKLAFVTKSGGTDQIRIVDVAKHQLVKTIDTRLSSVAGPDWSRTGGRITFAGVDSGRCDIFLYDFASDKVRRLTRSLACKSDPHFSPDGAEIIYAVQDTCTRVDDPPFSAWGATQSDLAVLTVATGKIRPLTATAWNEKQPCFSPHGDSVLFVSDRNGIDNIYIASIDSMQNARAVTDFIGGCSNPDWSADGSSVVFTLFQKLGWDVWLMDKPQEKKIATPLARTQWVEAMLDTSHHYFLPAPAVPDTARPAKEKLAKKEASPKTPEALRKPSDSVKAPLAAKTDSGTTAGPSKTPSAAAAPAHPAKDSIDRLVEAVTATAASADTTHARPALAIPSSEPYRLKFSPDLVTVGLGMSSFYGYAGQWLLSLSDIMGDHRITLAGDVQNDFESTMHFFGSYLYMKKRLDYGGGAYYYKDYTGYSDSLYYYDAETGAFFVASYPFSMFSRCDFQLLGRTINRTPRGYDSAVAHSGGTYAVNTLMPSVSYSYDNILWGMTGPMNGMRGEATLQVLPPLSFINEPFLSFDLDVRHYWHLFKRFVWANRLFVGASQPLSSGPSPRRYLLGGNENWLFTYSDINYDQYERSVRYAFYSDMVVPFRGWRYFDLTGTRAAVWNTEFRFPFIREFSTVFPLPLAVRYVNGAVFADLGNAWDRADQAGSLPLPKKVYGGVGFGMRVNLGMFLLRYDRGWPADVGEQKTTGAPVNYFSLGAEF